MVRDTTGQEAWSFFHNMYRPDGSLAEQVVFNRDRSRIVSEFNDGSGTDDWDERHTVIGPDGSKFIFETSGDTQTIYDGEGRAISAAVWTDHGPEPLPLVQQALLPGALAGAGVAAGEGAIAEIGLAAAAAVLFSWLSVRNGPDGTAVLAFKAVEYRQQKDEEGKIEAAWVGRLNREQMKKACEQLDDVQRRTDEAVDEVRKEGKYNGPADFGTKVHKRIADGIDVDGGPNYIAEVSLEKSKMEADDQQPLNVDEDDAKSRTKRGRLYGKLNTVRIDVLENRPELSTVCVYDPKTGKRGLSLRRMGELSQTVQINFPKTQHIIVTEVRPSHR